MDACKDDSDSEDTLRLSEEAAAALAEFYAEGAQTDNVPLTDPLQLHFKEDWQLSQFWYSADTAKALAEVAFQALGSEPASDKCIALLCCPTLYPPIKRRLPDGVRVMLLEFDERFRAYGPEWIHYDYRRGAEALPVELHGACDVLLIDPPFLSSECLGGVASAVRILARRAPPARIVLCTGAVMEDYVRAELPALRRSRFVPVHNNNLANDFACFSNFDIDSLLDKITSCPSGIPKIDREENL